MREVRLWTCPAGTAVPPFPQVQDPPMQVQLPDAALDGDLASGLQPTTWRAHVGRAGLRGRAAWRMRWN